MQIKVATITIEGEDSLTMRYALTRALEGEEERYDIQLKQIRNKQGFVVEEKLKIYKKI